MEKKFSSVAATEDNKNWEKLTERRDSLYSRKDDIRSPFARDYTRVLHSLAYRRLKHKTQVFFNAAGNDHICTRIEHVSHVESVSSTVARQLGLNEELTKAIATAHDLGHAPFGHEGERIIRSLTEEYLGYRFWHEKNGVYLVDDLELLEDNECNLKNLDLTYAVRDGIISHCGEVDENGLFPREELFDLSAFEMPGQFQAATWEGCVVKLADKIAYLGRDIEDAKRLGFLSKEDVSYLEDMAGIRNEKAINTTVIMHNMILDLCENSSPEQGLRLSEEMNEQLSAIKQFNYDHIYSNPRMKPFTEYSELIIRHIFEKLRTYYEGESTISYIINGSDDTYGFVRSFADWLVMYVDDEVEVPDKYYELKTRCHNKKIYSNLSDEKLYLQAVIDYIAGMTDVYAIKAFQELLAC